MVLPDWREEPVAKAHDRKRFDRDRVDLKVFIAQYALSSFRLARLAVARNLQRQGLGGQLLARAIARCMRVSAEVGGTALLVDAKDEPGAAGRRLYGAVSLKDRSLSLVIPYGEFNRAREAAELPPLQI